MVERLIIAVANVKGGTDKTTTAAALAARKCVSLYLPEATHSRLWRAAVDRACRHLPCSTCLHLVSLAVLRHVPGEGDGGA